jgi:hypothetical protein
VRDETQQRHATRLENRMAAAFGRAPQHQPSFARALSTALVIAIVSGAIHARQTSVPSTYTANTSRTVIVEPALPSLGSAGFQFVDPAFGSRLLRVTDPDTHPEFPGASWVTGSAAHQLAWNAASDRFWVRSVMGAYIAYNFNGTAMTATRITTTTPGDGGLIFSQLEPQFSFVSPDVLYGTRQAGVTNHPVIRKFDFSTLSYTDIIDLAAIDPAIPNPSYARALAGSAAAPEKLSILYGGAQPSQDLDFKVAVFQVGSPILTWAILDSLASTITRPGGLPQPTTIPLGFRLHHQWIDLTGRYVLLYPINGTFPPPMPYFIWDLDTDVVTRVDRFPGGHDALGYARQVNQDCCTTTDYDAAQWQLRPLATPTATTDLINPVLTPEVLLLGEHTSWNNAQPGALVPILSSLYRYGSPQPPWRAWDEEIIAIQTNAGPAGATVWRFAHHRSNISYDGGSGSEPYYFWYLPRAMISPNGRFAMFTSNWEKTLGSTVGSDVEPGGAHRCDVFIVALVNPSAAFTDDPLVAGSTPVKAVHITELRSRIDALRIRFGLQVYTWTDPNLAAGTLVRAVHVTQLREALAQAYTAASRTEPSYSDPAIAPQSTVIKAVHIQELRTAVAILEAG